MGVLCTPVAADSITIEGTLSTSGQSMWQAGEGGSLSFQQMLLSDVGWGSRANPLEFDVKNFHDIEIPSTTVANPRWHTWTAKKNAAFTVLGKTVYPLGKPIGSEPPKTLTIPGLDLGTVGLGVEGSTHGRFGLGVDAQLTTGSVDVNIPMAVTISFDETKVQPGNKLTISTDFVLGGGANMSTVSPEAKAGIFMDVDMALDAVSDVKLGDSVDVPPILPSFDLDTRMQLLGFDTGDVTVLGMPAGELANTVIEEIAAQVADSLGLPNDDSVGDEAFGLLQEIAGAAEKAQKDVEEALKKAKLDVRKAEYDKERAVAESQRQGEAIEKIKQENERTVGEIADNDSQIAERDALLDDPNVGADQKAKVQAEKDYLVKRNEELDSRSKKLNEQINEKSTKQKDALNKAAEADQRKKKAESDAIDKAIDRAKAKVEANQKNDSVEEARKTRRKKTLFDALKKLKDAAGKAADFLNIMDGELTAPVVTTYSDVSQNGNTLQFANNGMADEEQFAEISLSVDDLIGTIVELGAKAAAGAVTAGAGAFVELPPLNAEFSFTDYLNAEYSVLDLNVGARAYVQQAFDYKPEFEVVIRMPDGSEIVFDLGDSVEIQLPDDLDGFELKPMLRVKASSFTNNTGIRIEPFAELSVLGAAAGIVVPEAFRAALGRDSLGIELGPLVGSIDSSFDLIPNDYPITTVPVINVFSQEWQLGGFNAMSLGSIGFSAPEVAPIPGGTLDSLDGWQTLGAVVLENGAAKLTTQSPVGLAATIDTPFDPFYLYYDYDFLNPNGGSLSVFLNGSLLDSLWAGTAPNAGTHSIYVDDASLLGLMNATLLFEYIDTTGSSLLLDNVLLSGVVQTQVTVEPVPEPSTFLLFGAAAVALAWRRRRRSAA